MTVRRTAAFAAAGLVVLGLGAVGGWPSGLHAAPADQPPGAAPAAPAPPPTVPPTLPSTWVAGSTATLIVLDKVDARSRTVTVDVDKPATVGSLTILMAACMHHPPDQDADAAAYLTITDSHPGGPGFTGWMIRSAPAVGVFEHPVYDVKVAGCR